MATNSTSVQLPLLPDFLTTPRRPLLTLLIAYLLSIVGSLALSSLVFAIEPATGSPDFGWLSGRGMFAVVMLAGIAPLLETLILAATTSILLFFLKPKFAIPLSALGWAIAHSLQTPAWGLIIWWPFVIFTTLYVVWKQRSLAWGLAMPFAAHAMQNLLPAIGVGFPELLPVV